MSIQELIQKNKEQNLRIAVIGDCMIDQYHYGHVSRVSPEFPVQVLTSAHDTEDLYPGGAANVCHQMTHFNVESFLIGLVDEPARCLYSEQAFDCSYCVDLYSGRVPRKVRFYDGDFPLLRWDIERPDYGENTEELERLRKEIVFNFNHLADSLLNIVILSDYNKGLWGDGVVVAEEIISLCNQKKIRTIVDPKCKPLEKWKNCTVFKPNANEAYALTGLTDWKKQANSLQYQLGCQAVVITQSGAGVVGKCDDEYFEYKTPRRLRSKEVNSVIGAGDCFNAMLSICLGHNIAIRDACAIAFEAGIQYVKARHNKPLTTHDIYSRFDNPYAKIVTLEELLYLKNNIYTNEDFVFTNGCFDAGLTGGHIECLKYAKSLGNKLIVGINSDESVSRLKGASRPILPLPDRMKIISSLECVNFVVSFNEDTPLKIIKKIRPKIIVKGGDYKPEDVVGFGLADVCICPYHNCISTTDKIKLINENSENIPNTQQTQS